MKNYCQAVGTVEPMMIFQQHLYGVDDDQDAQLDVGTTQADVCCVRSPSCPGDRNVGAVPRTKLSSIRLITPLLHAGPPAVYSTHIQGG
jgi:hypothetical protein